MQSGIKLSLYGALQFSTMSREPVSTRQNVFRIALTALFLPLIVPFLILALIFSVLNKAFVYLWVWLWWLPRGKDVLYISSDSPIWKEYMETEIRPLVAKRAIVLSWSARSKWPNWSLAARAFRTFGRRRDFNPMVVLFRPLRPAKIFRFLPAFHEWKHGDRTRVEELRRDLTHAL